MGITIDLIAPTPEVVAIDVINPDQVIELTVVSGKPGADGVGIPVGGTIGQILAKNSGSNYDMEWVDAPAGTGGTIVTSVNGVSGVIVLTQDSIPDGTTHKQYTTVEKTKLVGVATGATANDTDANLKNRANHTGAQTIATVTGLQAGLDAKSPLASPAFTGTPTGITKAHVGLGNVDNTTDTAKPVSVAQQTALDGKSNTGHTHIKSEVGLANVDNTTDAAKPVSTATQTALDGKAATSHAHTASQVTDFSTAVDARIQTVIGTAPANLDTLGELSDALGDDANFAATVTTALAGKASDAALTVHLTNTANPHAVTKAQVGLGSVDNTADTAKPVSTAQQTALNLKADAASPAFTGTPTGLTKSHVGLANVDNTADSAKPVSTAQQSALDAKAPLASPAFTGTPTGITKTHVGLGSVDNTADTAKPVSTAQQTALDKTPAVIVKAGTWPARTTVTSNTSRTVWFLGAAPGPTDAQAVDIWDE